MSIYQQIFVSLVVLGILYFLSMQFNRYIDTRRELFDGETAVWVIVGTAYTLVGAMFLVLLWWHELQAISAPWQAAATITGTVLLCFVASGIPMTIGDAVRAHNRRKENGGD